MSSDRLNLIHCEERLRRIQKYCEAGRAAFMASRMHQDAVLWNLQMICATGRCVSEEEKVKHPHIDWHGLCNMFDGILDVELMADPERIWKVMETAVPMLQHQIRLMLAARV